FNALKLSAYLFGQFNLFWRKAITFEQVIAHSFIASIVIVIEVQWFAHALQVIKCSSFLGLANLLTNIVLEFFAIILSFRGSFRVCRCFIVRFTPIFKVHDVLGFQQGTESTSYRFLSQSILL